MSRALAVGVALALAGGLQAAGQAPGTSDPPPDPLRYYGLVFGVSERPQVEAFLGEDLSCGDYPPIGRREDVERARVCIAADSPTARAPEVIFVDGTLRVLRYLLAESVTAEQARAALQARFGEPERRRGRGARSNLRYWSYPTAPYTVTLSEARHRRSGSVRLRVGLADPTGGWWPRGEPER